VFYGLYYRTAEGRQRWFTIGEHGAPWTPELARDEYRLLGMVVNGADPAATKGGTRDAETISELFD
jgi:hypothetical protein